MGNTMAHGADVYAYSLHTATPPLPAYDCRLFAYSATVAYALDGHGCFLLFADLMLMPSTGMGFFAYSATVAYASGIYRFITERAMPPP